MIISIFKNIIIFFCTIYVSNKILKHKPQYNTFFSTMFALFNSLILSTIFNVIKTYYPKLSYIIPLLLLWIIKTSHTLLPKATFITTIFSFSISYGLFVIAGYSALIPIYPFFYKNKEFPFFLLSILTAILQITFTVILFKMKRFRNGFSILSVTPINNFCSFICIIIILYLMNKPTTSSPSLQQIISPTIFIFLLFFLIHWWQAQITKSYKRSLQLRELESLRMELAEKEKQVAELSKQNEALGRLIHKDNKLIPAMEHAVHEYFITDFDNLNAAKEKAQTLLIEIEELSKNRSNIILEMNVAKSKHYNTGIPSLDTLLNYMDKRACQEHIALSVHFGVELTEYVPNIITPEDLTHMLSDLLENAIIATKGRANANIQLQFYMSEKSFIIEISDNGTPFEIASLVNFGIDKLTTHADSGGSGIGLMDIWEIKEKYFASLHITELKENAPFTKKIAFIFNKKNRYSISSARKEEITQASKRADLHIFE